MPLNIRIVIAFARLAGHVDSRAGRADEILIQAMID